MKEKFTQGDWFPCYGSYNVSILDEKGFESVRISYTADDSIACDIEAKANQSLIAAAPEMYRLLSRLSDFNCPGEYMEEDEIMAFSNIEKLLSKARGDNA